MLTLYLLLHDFVGSLMASSISRNRNLSSTKCRTNHFRSFVHSSVLSTRCLHRSIAFVKSSIDASWSRINCHCSFIKLLGIACDFSELVSSPEIDVDAIDVHSTVCAVSSIGDGNIVVDDDAPLIKLPTAFGICAKLPRIERIFSQTHTNSKSIYFTDVTLNWQIHFSPLESNFNSFDRAQMDLKDFSSHLKKPKIYFESNLKTNTCN